MMSDETPDAPNDSAGRDETSRRRRGHTVSSVAIPYGSDELSSFLPEEWETPWEINHSITSPPR
jgi:hypothetical protein